jgi:hypothetical protein
VPRSQIFSFHLHPETIAVPFGLVAVFIMERVEDQQSQSRTAVLPSDTDTHVTADSQLVTNCTVETLESTYSDLLCDSKGGNRGGFVKVPPECIRLLQVEPKIGMRPVQSYSPNLLGQSLDYPGMPRKGKDGEEISRRVDIEMHDCLDSKLQSMGYPNESLVYYLSFLMTKLESRVQEPHVDYPWARVLAMEEDDGVGVGGVATVEGISPVRYSLRTHGKLCRKYRDRVPFVLFFPLCDGGMRLELWKDDFEDRPLGTIVDIPIGFGLLARGDVIHAGGFLMDSESGDMRAHLYVYRNGDGPETHLKNSYLFPDQEGVRKGVRLSQVLLHAKDERNEIQIAGTKNMKKRGSRSLSNHELRQMLEEEIKSRDSLLEEFLSYKSYAAFEMMAHHDRISILEKHCMQSSNLVMHSQFQVGDSTSVNYGNVSELQTEGIGPGVLSESPSRGRFSGNDCTVPGPNVDGAVGVYLSEDAAMTEEESCTDIRALREALSLECKKVRSLREELGLRTGPLDTKIRELEQQLMLSKKESAEDLLREETKRAEVENVVLQLRGQIDGLHSQVQSLEDGHDQEQKSHLAREQSLRDQLVISEQLLSEQKKALEKETDTAKQMIADQKITLEKERDTAVLRFQDRLDELHEFMRSRDVDNDRERKKLFDLRLLLQSELKEKNDTITALNDRLIEQEETMRRELLDGKDELAREKAAFGNLRNAMDSEINLLKNTIVRLEEQIRKRDVSFGEERGSLLRKIASLNKQLSSRTLSQLPDTDNNHVVRKRARSMGAPREPDGQKN